MPRISRSATLSGALGQGVYSRWRGGCVLMLAHCFAFWCPSGIWACQHALSCYHTKCYFWERKGKRGRQVPKSPSLCGVSITLPAGWSIKSPDVSGGGSPSEKKEKCSGSCWGLLHLTWDTAVNSTKVNRGIVYDGCFITSFFGGSMETRVIGSQVTLTMLLYVPCYVSWILFW